MILLDSDVMIDILRNYPPALEWFDALDENEEIALPGYVLMDLIQGCRNKAHLYGLSRDDFAYILDTFPVLKRKEEKAFGEFMSKRKCLEEYERVGRIMNYE
jgi:predicted nucleic acid-binding protein